MENPQPFDLRRRTCRLPRGTGPRLVQWRSQLPFWWKRFWGKRGKIVYYRFDFLSQAVLNVSVSFVSSRYSSCPECFLEGQECLLCSDFAARSSLVDGSQTWIFKWIGSAQPIVGRRLTELTVRVSDYLVVKIKFRHHHVHIMILHFYSSARVVLQCCHDLAGPLLL